MKPSEWLEHRLPDLLKPVVIQAPSALVLRRLADFDAYAEWRAPIRVVGTAAEGAAVEIEVRSRMPWTKSLAIRYPGRISELSSSKLVFMVGLQFLLTIELGFVLEDLGARTKVSPSARVQGIGRWIAGQRLKATFAQAAGESLRALDASFPRQAPGRSKVRSPSWKRRRS